MSTEIKATLTIKHGPSYEEILLLKDAIVEWVNEYLLEKEALRLDMNGEMMYES